MIPCKPLAWVTWCMHDHKPPGDMVQPDPIKQYAASARMKLSSESDVSCLLRPGLVLPAFHSAACHECSCKVALPSASAAQYMCRAFHRGMFMGMLEQVLATAQMYQCDIWSWPPTCSPVQDCSFSCGAGLSAVSMTCCLAFDTLWAAQTCCTLPKHLPSQPDASSSALGPVWKWRQLQTSHEDTDDLTVPCTYAHELPSSVDSLTFSWLGDRIFCHHLHAQPVQH